MSDPYRDGTCRWWHLSAPSPELLDAEAAGELGALGVAVDLGCGLGSELGYLAGRGWRGFGVDLSRAALAQARAQHPGVAFARADVTRLPLQPGAADLLLDRGCFHYLPGPARARYAQEAARLLRPDGLLLLRMCLNSAGEPNGLGEESIRAAFGGWRLAALESASIASDTRTMPAILALLRPPEPRSGRDVTAG
ncbi:MAG TPA: methyltransferase domain-containing protein [Streptosporangiaceae bacterium]